MSTFPAIPFPRVLTHSDDASLVASSVSWVIQRQSQRGYWSADTKYPSRTDLDSRVILTTQAVQALVASGMSPSDPSIKKAVDWLKTEADKSSYFYLRIPALICSGNDVANTRDIAWIKYQVETGQLSRLPSLLDMVCCALYLLRVNQKSSQRVEKAVGIIMERWNGNSFGESLPGDAFAALLLHYLDHERYSNIFEKVLERIRNSSTFEPVGISFQQSIGVTAYVVLDLFELELDTDARFEDLVKNAILWIRSRRSDGCWPADETPAYVSRDPCYVTCMSIRAIAAANSRNPEFASQVASEMIRLANSVADKSRRSIRRFKVSIMFLSGLLLLLLARTVPFQEFSEQARLAFDFVVGGFTILGVLAQLFPSVRRKLFDRIIGRPATWSD